MSETATIQQEQTVGDTTPFLPADMCDACHRQQARVRVTTTAGVITFCGHDYAKAEPSLLAKGIVLHIHDERHLLLPQPYNPATDNS